MEPAAFSEIDPFPSAVLAARFPGVPNLGDMNNFGSWNLGAIDVLVGGTPCQSFSVAGLRKGLSDPRGNLALVYCGILERFKPQWFVWENVPGVLSSSGGRDFGSFLGAVAELGYGFAYRILDAQFCGVPQRRRRVFVVGCLGDWRRAAAVLFEPESMRRNSPKGPSQKQEIAKALRGRANISHREDADTVTHALRGEGFDASEDGTGRGTPLVAIAFNARQDPDSWVNRTGPIDTDGCTQAISSNMAVRRLTPRECERLQGFPDDWTLIEYRGKQAADGPRYKAIGNSMAVPCMRWIGERLSRR